MTGNIFMRQRPYAGNESRESTRPGGLIVAEHAGLCRLKVSNIDSQRMLLRVEQGEGGIDREVPLSKTLL